MSVYSRFWETPSVQSLDSSPILPLSERSCESYDAHWEALTGEVIDMQRAATQEVKAVKTKIKRRFQMYRIGVIAALFAWTFLSFLLMRPTPGALEPFAYISDLHAIGPTALCPGDSLRFATSINADGPVVYEIDASIWDSENDLILVTADSVRAVLPEDLQRTYEASWTIPQGMPDGAGGTKAWRPGEYKRVVAISTVSRNSKPTIATLPFSIKEDCGE